MTVNNFFIRQARTEDVDFLWQIDQQSNPHPWQREHFQAALVRQRVDVVEKKGKLLAYAVWQVLLDEAELHLLVTQQKYRKQGFAQALLIHFFADATIKRILLEARESNQAAIALYQKNGFTAIARRKDYYLLPTEDALIMERLC